MRVQRKTFNVWAVLVILSCTWITIGHTFHEAQQVSSINHLERDPQVDWYYGLGFSLAEGLGYHECVPIPHDYHCPSFLPWETAFRFPGYPVFLAATIHLFGEEAPVGPTNLLKYVLTGLVVLMTGLLTWRIAGHVAGMLAAIVLMLDPALYHYAIITSDNSILFAMLLLFFVGALAYATRPRRFFLAGLILGMALLTRGNVTWSLVLLPLVYRPWRSLVPVAVGVSLILVPWSVRNMMMLGAPATFTTAGGVGLWGANNPRTYGLDPLGPPTGSWSALPLDPAVEAQIQNELDYDRAAQNAALSFIRTVPIGTLARAVLQKHLNLFSLNAAWPAPFPFFAFLFAWLGVGFSLAVGIVRRIDSSSVARVFAHLFRQRAILIILALWLSNLISVSVVYGADRFRISFDPLLAILTACGLAGVLGQLYVGRNIEPLAGRRWWINTVRLSAGALAGLTLILLLTWGVPSDQLAKQTAKWLQNHVADYSAIAVDEGIQPVASYLPNNNWKWTIEPNISGTTPMDWQGKGVHYLVIDDRTFSGLAFSERVKRMLSGGATFLYQSSNPLGLRPYQAVFWTFRPAYELNLIIDDSLRLIGYDIQDNGSEAAKLLFYWYTTKPTVKDFHYFVHVVDPTTGELIAQGDTPVGRGIHLTSTWRLNEIIFDPIPLPVDALTGRERPYHLTVGFYTLPDGVRAPIQDAQENLLGTSIELIIK